MIKVPEMVHIRGLSATRRARESQVTGETLSMPATLPASSQNSMPNATSSAGKSMSKSHPSHSNKRDDTSEATPTTSKSKIPIEYIKAYGVNAESTETADEPRENQTVTRSIGHSSSSSF